MRHPRNSRAGSPDAKVLEKDPDLLYTVSTATLAYAQQVADEIKRKGNGGDGDGADLVQQLHQLREPREVKGLSYAPHL